MSGGDHFAALPDEILQHVLSYLPSRNAVQSSVLARRWCHLWRSTPAVRVRGSNDLFRRFVNILLLSRDASPLRLFEIDADLLIGEVDEDYYDEDNDPREVDPYVDAWIRHAVTTCRARSLIARIQDEDDIKWSPRQRLPFASPHLTTMRLHGVKLAAGLLDFACCPALLELSLGGCHLEGDAFASPSLERLCIIDCHIGVVPYSDWPTRMRIFTPSLRHLQLSDENAEGVSKAPSLP